MKSSNIYKKTIINNTLPLACLIAISTAIGFTIFQKKVLPMRQVGSKGIYSFAKSNGLTYRGAYLELSAAPKINRQNTPQPLTTSPPTSPKPIHRTNPRLAFEFPQPINQQQSRFEVNPTPPTPHPTQTHISTFTFRLNNPNQKQNSNTSSTGPINTSNPTPPIPGKNGYVKSLIKFFEDKATSNSTTRSSFSRYFVENNKTN